MKKFLLYLFFFAVDFTCTAQDEKSVKPQRICIGFWNVENLYDTIDDPLKNDDEFTPSGDLGWTSERYHKKIGNLSRAIAGMGTEDLTEGLVLLGLCEVENISVLNDLIRSPLLKGREYKAILLDGPDARGIDPALLYQPRFFNPQKVLSYPVQLPTDTSHKTRDILVVSGDFMGTRLC